LRFDKIAPKTDEDKILVMRLVWGIIVGFLFWLLDGRIIYFSGSIENSVIGWVTAVILYIATIPLVWYKYPNVKLKWKLGKGITVYLAAWMLTWFALYDITTPP